jgi:hypothetical protein
MCRRGCVASRGAGEENEGAKLGDGYWLRSRMMQPGLIGQVPKSIGNGRAKQDIPIQHEMAAVASDGNVLHSWCAGVCRKE